MKESWQAKHIKAIQEKYKPAIERGHQIVKEGFIVTVGSAASLIVGTYLYLQETVGDDLSRIGDGLTFGGLVGGLVGMLRMAQGLRQSNNARDQYHQEVSQFLNQDRDS